MGNALRKVDEVISLASEGVARRLSRRSLLKIVPFAAAGASVGALGRVTEAFASTCTCNWVNCTSCCTGCCPSGGCPSGYTTCCSGYCGSLPCFTCGWTSSTGCSWVPNCTCGTCGLGSKVCTDCWTGTCSSACTCLSNCICATCCRPQEIAEEWLRVAKLREAAA